jgi:hypothetical protein
MNGDPNPYAPPTVAEPEFQSSRFWQVVGIDLLAKSGATLPKVDLDTGVFEGPMKSIPRVVKTTRPMAIFTGLAFFGIYLFLREYLGLQSLGLLLPFFILLFLAKRLGILRDNLSSVLRVWTFVEESRAKRYTLRRRMRLGVLFLIFFSILAPPFLDNPGITWILIWLRWVLPLGALTIIALAIWSLMDRPKIRTKAESPGWMRISRVHPDALSYLMAEEQQGMQQEEVGPIHRKRLVHTVYYHKYPLRMLIGHRIWNPLAIFQITIMKFLRSKLLVRPAYHFSEAEKLPLEKLCPPLQQSIASWLAGHGDWSYVIGDHLTSPAGDLTVENAVLASPDRMHCIQFTRAWLEQKPEKGVTQYHFMTWLADGKHVTTHNHPCLSLSNPHLHHRAKGNPDQVFSAHLKNLSGLEPSAAMDIPELLERLEREKEETDLLLTEKGYQSGTHEAI